MVGGERDEGRGVRHFVSNQWAAGDKSGEGERRRSGGLWEPSQPTIGQGTKTGDKASCGEHPVGLRGGGRGRGGARAGEGRGSKGREGVGFRERGQCTL